VKEEPVNSAETRDLKEEMTEEVVVIEGMIEEAAEASREAVEEGDKAISRLAN
jgi:hypothetical protein